MEKYTNTHTHAYIHTRTHTHAHAHAYTRYDKLANAELSLSETSEVSKQQLMSLG